MRGSAWISSIALLSLLGCSKSTDDTSTDDTAGEPLPQAAALTALSNGECPDLSTSGTSSFLSSDEERTATIVIPTNPGEDMPVVFFLHGLMSPTHTPEPTDYMASALGLQTLADDHNAVFVLPESPIWEVMGFSYFLFDVFDNDDNDVVLYDDLRTCVGENLDVDLNRVSVMGFSGGSLFTSILVRDRSETLASFVEFSGGADYEISLMGDTAVKWTAPVDDTPGLIVAGGATDNWPDGFTVIDFVEATDNLQSHLLDAGHFVVRCDHDYGHTIPMGYMSRAEEWLLGHTYGLPSPWIESGVDDWGMGCYVAEADASAE